MNRLSNVFILFVIILIEGYIVLASELLAMRQTIPYVGTGTDTIAIIIAAVLMPLAVGYQAGGRFRIKGKDGSYRSIRKKLLMNILVASCFLLPALSFYLMMFFFGGLSAIGVDHNLVQLTLYCVIFLVYPVFLLGQTVPLVSNYFSKSKLSQITGKMLCFSTLGSFCGSIVTTLILMSFIGVHHTVTFIFVMLFALVYILSHKRQRDYKMFSFSVLAVCALLNSNMIMDQLGIVENNKYSTIMVFNVNDEGDFDPENGAPHLIINHNDSSMYSEDGQKHDYIEFAERITIESWPENAAPADVLIIGAGGFTFGHNDLKNNFIYIDIDKDLKDVSEQYLLKEKLQPNKTFYPLPARAFLNGEDTLYDIIFLDAYLGGLSIPEHLVTQEFFQEIKDHLKDGGVMVSNFIVSPNFQTVFSKNIDNTLRAVFPYVSRQDTKDEYQIWTDSPYQNSNFMYVYKHHKDIGNGGIYRDIIAP